MQEAVGWAEDEKQGRLGEPKATLSPLQLAPLFISKRETNAA